MSNIKINAFSAHRLQFCFDRLTITVRIYWKNYSHWTLLLDIDIKRVISELILQPKYV